ncbi:hypothetical protein RB601_008121 [Gaeumannomyces tritici]
MPDTAPRIISSLADLSDAQVAQLASRCGGMEPGRVEDVYSCTPMQLDMIREDRAEALHFILHSGPEGDIDRFCAATRDVAAANPVLRTRLALLDGDGGDGGPQIVQVVLKGEHVTTRRAADRGKSEEEEVRLYLEDSDAEPMGLGRSLFRTVFIGRTFIASVHHAVIDYWSIMTLLTVDIHSVYLEQGIVARPPFKSFAARSLALDEPAARSFWAGRFQGTAAVFPPPAATARQHRRRPRIVAEPERHIPLPRVADGTVPQSHVPFFVEAAWALTASALSGSESVAYGCVLSGRSPPLPGGLEATLGPALAEVPVQAVLPRRATTVGRLVRDRAAALRELFRQDPALLHCGPARIAQLAGGGVAVARAAAFTTLINVLPAAADGTTTAKPHAEIRNGHGDSNGNGAGGGPHSEPAAEAVAQDEIRMDAVWVNGSHPLQLIFIIRADGVSLRTRFDAEALGRRALARILAQLDHSLRLLTEAAPDTRLDALPLLHPDAAAEIARWNDAARTASPRPPAALLHSLFEQQVRERPHAVAVSSSSSSSATERGGGGAESLTYSALDGRASRLAGELRRRFGVRRGSRVGVLLGPSVWAAVAVLGILKAGAAYVPVVDVREGDDEQERGRNVSSYLAAAGVKLSLASTSGDAKSLGTVQRVLPLKGGQIPGGVVLLGELASPLGVSNGGEDDYEETRVEEGITPDDPACIIPTSGITGPAKAVELTHGNLSRTLAALAQRLDWGPDCRMLQSAPLATGASVIETLAALCFGGCLCAGPTVRSEDDVSRLSAFITSSEANWAILHPHILSCLSPDMVPCLGSVLATGDGVTDETRQRWSAPGRRFFVGWGATEASVLSTVAEARNEADKADGGSTPATPGSNTGIGQPIGCAVWIVNPSNTDELAPLGGVGELLVEGAGLAAAHCYVNDGGVRATKPNFIPAPRWAAAAAAPQVNGDAKALPRFFFRTGDLGQYDLESAAAAPSIHLVGRSDNCVAVVGAAQRGRSTAHLEQIEAAASESGLVREVAVVSRIAAGRTALVAVVALAAGGQPPSHGGDDAVVPQRTLFPVPGDVAGQRLEAVREYASSRLPAEQLPSAWLAVERLPRTVSHKIDRAALKKWLKTNAT